ncbi:hypothetical protein H3H37_19870 [Duganella sp. LX20W]|uniref:YXWGXW repeat-containing protein n=1 Tax=Rugamonas brunnea TaxID=2758569 RepID=A0A7W2EVE4_9BURK|nr:hypothetical protein [Rugamonas brunnea]MBA5639323.1 hypothetical protein [Rugamonas brunnea]
MRNRLLLCWLLAGAPLVGSAATYVSVNFNLSTYPELAPVPGYPVYYAPRLRANFFFYDGLYWLLSGDSWYVSSWYNGPWSYVGPDAVPLFILRIPVRYYLAPPVYFVDWRRDAPPMWGRHWGPDWERRHEGWERWNQRAVPARAPLPTYQRQYAGSRYPQPAQQQTLQNQHYRYRPHDAVAQQHFQAPGPAPFTAPERQHAPPGRQEHGQQQQRPPQQEHGQQRPPQQEHGQQRQQPVPYYGQPPHAPQPLPSPPPNRMETNRPPPQREQGPYQQAMPQGHGAPPREAAPRPERGEERRGPPARQNEGRRDKDQHDER